MPPTRISAPRSASTAARSRDRVQVGGCGPDRGRLVRREHPLARGLVTLYGADHRVNVDQSRLHGPSEMRPTGSPAPGSPPRCRWCVPAPSGGQRGEGTVGGRCPIPPPHQLGPAFRGGLAIEPCLCRLRPGSPLRYFPGSARFTGRRCGELSAPMTWVFFGETAGWSGKLARLCGASSTPNPRPISTTRGHRPWPASSSLSPTATPNPMGRTSARPATRPWMRTLCRPLINSVSSTSLSYVASRGQAWRRRWPSLAVEERRRRARRAGRRDLDLLVTRSLEQASRRRSWSARRGPSWWSA